MYRKYSTITETTHKNQISVEIPIIAEETSTVQIKIKPTATQIVITRVFAADKTIIVEMETDATTTTIAAAIKSTMDNRTDTYES